MARRPRAFEPGHLYHVFSRGNNRQRIYVNRVDCNAFLEMFNRLSHRHDVECTLYCLMPNHYHAVVRSPEQGISSMFQELNGGYSRSFNRRHSSEDHLFRNRFRAVHVARESHLVELARYVVLNPVRAALCRQAHDWPWSSFRASIGLERAPAFLADETLLGHFSSDLPRARELYAAFVQAGTPSVSDTVADV